MPCLFLQIHLDAVGDVLLEVIEEEAVVVQVVALGAEHGSAVGGDGVELFFCDGGYDDGAADGVNPGVGDAGGDELAVVGQRTEVLLDRGGGVVALPVDRVDADAARGFTAVSCHYDRKFGATLTYGQDGESDFVYQPKGRQLR